MLTFKDLLMTGTEGVCLSNDNMIITDHNQNLSLLLGQPDINLKGQNLSTIFYDDQVIRRLTEKDTQFAWRQGECILRSCYDFPLLVKFRAGKVVDNNLQESTNVFIFREINELQQITFSRRINAIKSLINSVLDPDVELEHILLNFASAYDQDATTILFDTNLSNINPQESKNKILSSKQALLTAQVAVNNKVPILLQSEKLLCFIPIYSKKAIYGVACIMFSIPRLYDEEDKFLFDLCGKVLGSYMEQSAVLDYNSYTLFQIIFENVKQPIVVVNFQGLITMLNNSAKAIYGYTESEMLGNSLGNTVFPAESSINYNDLISKIMEGHSIHNIDMTHIRSDFTMIDVNVTAYPYKNHSGTMAGAIFIMEYKGEQKILKDKMEQWEKLSVLGELLHSAANELNNSLTSVIGHSEILAQIDSCEKINDMSSKIYKGAIRCGNVVKGLIDLARDNEIQKGYSNIDEVLGYALDLKRYQLRSNNIKLHLKLDENIPRISADLHNVERLFLHIINYAEKRILEYDNKGELNIEINSNETDVIARFIDTGTCIFKYNKDSTQLYISDLEADADVDLIASCYILGNIGGSIQIDSQIGKYNTITLKLPIINSIPAELAKNKIEISTQLDKTGKRILLVDDEVDIVDLLNDFLQEKGYIVDIARDGNEAIEKVFRNGYDLIVSDLKMPNGFTGSKLHGFIKRENPDLAKRMIFMTGDIINQETQKFLQGTGNPYLEKPFLPESLMEIISGIEV